MKRIILFPFLFVLFTNGIGAETISINLFNDPIPPGPIPHSLTYIPASATINETDLSVYFEEPVGAVTITVYDALNQAVGQEVVNTDTTTEMHIPVYLWDSGTYTLTVTYGTKTLRGEFDIP